MACKRSEQCEHADICQYAKSNAYDILGGSCYRPKKPQTNEEYIRSCSTEELTEFLITVAFEKRFKELIHWRGYANMHSYQTEVRQWLKEKHE